MSGPARGIRTIIRALLHEAGRSQAHPAWAGGQASGGGRGRWAGGGCWPAVIAR